MEKTLQENNSLPLQEWVNAACKRLSEWLGGFASEFEKAMQNLEETYANVFVGIKWTPEANPFSKVTQRTIELYQSGKVKEAERLYRKFALMTYGKEAIDEMLNEWERNESLLSRIHILRQAITAHQMGLYYLSVPVLCGQVEGFLYDMDQYVGHVKQKEIIRILGDKEKYSYFSKVLQRFAKEILLVGFDWGSEETHDLSRNAILHGYDLKYGTKANSLKLILLMNLLQVFK